MLPCIQIKWLGKIYPWRFYQGVILNPRVHSAETSIFLSLSEHQSGIRCDLNIKITEDLFLNPRRIADVLPTELEEMYWYIFDKRFYCNYIDIEIKTFPVEYSKI